MPRKKHHYPKSPQTTHHAAPSVAASDSSSRPKSVNEILESLRRGRGGATSGTIGSAAGSASPSSSMALHEPTLPPDVRRFLQIPDTPPPRPRRPVGVHGRRLPAGPPPPLSWQARTAADDPRSQQGSAAEPARSHPGPSVSEQARAGLLAQRLPGTYSPGKGTLLDFVLKATARDWGYQAAYNRFHLYALPSRVRVSLITYVSIWGPGGVSAHDLRLLLRPPLAEDLMEYGIEVEDDDDDDDEALNQDIFQLDVSGSAGQSIKIKELGEVLFPRRRDEETQLLDSWDVSPASLPPLPHLLPNLTHLSLAAMPLDVSPLAPVPRTAPSWHELLALAPKLSALTHLSLAHWPVPSRTQNAKLASFAVPLAAGGASRVMPYGATGPYSHTLDDDFSEAVNVLRHLSKALYRLEHLDLTGCAVWCLPALTRADSGGNYVDWLGNWGKLTTLRVGSGHVGCVQRPVALAPSDASASLKGDDVEQILGARRLERHIVARRAGIGRPITVETDWKFDLTWT